MKFICLTILLLPLCAAAEESPSSPHESNRWFGIVQPKSSPEFILLSGEKTYELSGVIEKHLKKFQGKEVSLWGDILDDGSISVSKAVPIVVKSRRNSLD